MRQRILKWIGALAIAGALPACAQVQLINQVQEIPNVDAATISDGEVLTWQAGTTNKWIGAAGGGVSGLTNPLNDHLDTTATYGITNDTSGVGLSLGASAMTLYGNLTIGQGTDFLISRTDDDESIVMYGGSGLFKGAGFALAGEDDATIPGDARFLYGGGTVASAAQSASSFVVSRLSATDTTTEMMELDWNGNLLLHNGTPDASSGSVRLDGAAVGDSNVAFMSFYDSGGTRRGYVGDAATGNDEIYLNADTGDIYLLAGNDDVFIGSATVTDPQILHIYDGGADNEPGQLKLYDDAGNAYTLFVSTAGALRFAAGAVTDDDTDGTALGAGGSGAFSDASDPVVLNTTTKDVAIGAALINSAKLSVDGDADQVQFAIQGHSTQTANVLEIENSGGTVVFSVDVSGNMTIGGDLTAGELIITEAAAAPTVAAGEGAFWVKNDTPSSPYFTDDATTDFELAVVGGALGAATATSPAAADDDTSVATTEWVQDELQRKIYIPAGAMIPNTTAGAASGTTELATNDIMFDSMDFDSSNDEFVGFWGVLPDNWVAGGSFAFEFHWTAASGSGDVYWTAGAIVFDNDDAMDAAVTLATAASDTLLTANDMHIGSTISAQTIAGTDNPGDPFYVKISRDADNVGNTLAADAKLIGVTITW